MPRTARILSCFTAIIVAACLAPGGAPAAPPPSDAPSTTYGADRTVTLVTGDVVTLGPDVNGRPTVVFEPADGPTGYSVTREEGHLTVLPTDVAALVPDVLDPALFDVTGLLAMGYGDSERDSLPLIVRHAPGVRTLADDSILTADSELDSIGASGVALDKSDAPEFGDALEDINAARPRATAAAPLGGAQKIWLDARVQTSATDRYLQQVRANGAWDAGLDGSGVSVAVLDTGVDTGHPALDGVVAEQADFTGGNDPGDVHGHGTHVTSLIAGNGAGSGGARQGIAPEADILNAKVLADDGRGQQSWLIDGMEWAVDHGADVVNLSLSSRPTGADDVVTQSLDRLTAQTGTLFVAAAGNGGGLGPSPFTIESPGSAKRALTVGAVREDDGLAGFSSEGPTLGTYRLKPDVSAPGVGILGARAGAREGDLYIPMQGTSQSTPIVAGAAALLAQRHPGWSPSELKARIVSTARSGPEQSAWSFGGGILDLDRATSAPILTDTASLDYGLFRHPDESVRERVVTVRNPGDEAVTLDVVDHETGRNGRAAPDGAVTANPATLTVPAGGTASTTISFDSSAVPDGLWQGHAAFVNGGETLLRMPIGAYDEEERYDLRITVLDRNGDPYRQEAAQLHPMADPTIPIFDGQKGMFYRLHLDENGQARARVAPGKYSVFARIATPTHDGGATLSTSGTPELDVSSDTELTIDARNAKRIRPPRIAGQDTTVENVALVYARHAGPIGYTESVYLLTPAEIERGRVFAEPSGPVRFGRFDVDLHWRLEPTGRTTPRTPDAYELDLTYRRMPDTTHSRLTRRDVKRLARVENEYHALRVPSEATAVRAYLNRKTTAVITYRRPIRVPANEVVLMTADPDVAWLDCLDVAPSAMRPLCGPERTYADGEKIHSEYGSSLHAMAFEAHRTEQTLFASIGLGDGAHAGKTLLGTHHNARLVLRDTRGRLLGRADDSFGSFAVDGDARRLRLTHSWRIDPTAVRAEERSRTVWTFDATPPEDPTKVGSISPPLLNVDYGPEVDNRGFARARRRLPMHLSFDHVVGSDSAARVQRARLWWSSDKGSTWHGVRVHRDNRHGFRATVPARAARAGHALSFKVSARDAEGNDIRQTSIGLIPVR